MATSVDTTFEEKYLRMALDYIAARRTLNVEILLIDNSTRQPLVGIPVRYTQDSHDFVFASLGILYGAASRNSTFVNLNRQLGADWNDLPLFWSKIEPVRGTFDFGSTDDLVDKLSGLGARQLFVEVRAYPEPGPSWIPPAWTRWGTLITNASFLSTYEQYVYEFVYNVAKHYLGRVTVWQVGLEYNWRLGGKPGPKNSYYFIPFTPDQALELAKVQARAVRDADPNAVILLGASDPVRGWDCSACVDPVDWAKLAIARGVDFDGVAIEAHWADGPPSFFYDYLKKFVDMGKPAYINEAQHPAAPLMVDYQTSIPRWWEYDEQTQALWTKYMVTYAFALGLGIDEFPFFDQVYPAYPASKNKLGLVSPNGTARAAYYTYSDLIRQFTTNGTTRTNGQGKITFSGFAGSYTVAAEGYRPIRLSVVENATNSFNLHLIPLFTITTATTHSTATSTHTEETPWVVMAGNALLTTLIGNVLLAAVAIAVVVAIAIVIQPKIKRSSPRQKQDGSSK
jgi:hypothetical protein